MASIANALANFSNYFGLLEGGKSFAKGAGKGVEK
jgi:hypothetical protein